MIRSQVNLNRTFLQLILKVNRRGTRLLSAPSEGKDDFCNVNNFFCLLSLSHERISTGGAEQKSKRLQKKTNNFDALKHEYFMLLFTSAMALWLSCADLHQFF